MDTPIITKEEADELLKTIQSRYPVLDPIEEGEQFTKLLPHYPQSKLSELIHKSRGYIGQRVRIYNNLIEPLKELLRNEQISYWDAYRLSGETEEEQKRQYALSMESLKKFENTTKLSKETDV